MPALILLAYFSLLQFGLIDNVRGPFFPEILGDLHLNGTRGSLIFATTSLLAVAGSWTSHRFIQRRSSVHLLAVASLLMSLGFMGVAFSPNYGLILFGSAVLGFGMGLMNLAQNLIVVEASPPHQRRRWMNGLHSMYGIAALWAPFIATFFRGQGLSWRHCFFALGFLPLALAGVSARAPAAKAVEARGAAALSRREWRICALFAVMVALYLWGEISVSTRMVLWLRTDRGFDADRADLYLGAFFLALLTGRVFFSFVHMARLGNWLIMWGSAGAATALYMAGLRWSPVFLAAGGLGLAPFYPIAMEQASMLFKEKTAQALGFVIGFGSLSVVIMHVTIGALSDSIGLTEALMVGPFALGAIFLGLSWLLYYRRRKMASPRPP
jgi:MFS family permease